MITQVEEYKDGHREVYHRAGSITVDGDVRRDEKFVWTHPEGQECSACESGTIPEWVKQGRSGP